MLTDREMILDSNTWPSWPFLPLKRPKDGAPDTGFMLEGKLVIYRLNMFSAANWDHQEMKRQFEVCQKHQYETVDALLADGWIID